MSRQDRKFRQAIRQTYRRQLSEYWNLPLSTRIKLAWAIVKGSKKRIKSVPPRDPSGAGT